MASFRRRFQRRRRDPGADKGTQGAQGSGLKPPVKSSDESGGLPKGGDRALTSETGIWRLLDTQLIPSEPGNERLAMARVAEAVKAFHLPEQRLNQLATAVAEATMNAMEHGNQYNPDVPVTLQILSSDQAIAVRISDRGGGEQFALEDLEDEAPDIEAKLAGLQSPRGWGLFLIRHMVDEMHVLREGETHIVELIMRLEEDARTCQNV